MNITHKHARRGATVLGCAALVALSLAAAHAQQTLYVTNYGSRTVECFTPGGVASVFASNALQPGSLNLPAFLAFGPTATPEPSQFVALGVGLLGLSALALRARRRGATEA